MPDKRPTEVQLCSFMGGILAMILLAFYWPFLFGQQDFFFKDTTDFFEPLCRYIGERLRHFQLPLWNPYSYCGMSQAAVSSPSIFFPLNWLFAVFPFSVCLALIMLVSQLVAFGGMLLLVASLGYDLLAAGLAGAVFALSGYMFSLSSNYTLVACAAWVPLLIYLAGRVALIGNGRFLVANAVATFFVLSGGRPEISAPAVLLSGAYGISCLGPSWAQRRAGSARLIASYALGALLSMPTLLPLLEWLPWSRRVHGMVPAEVLLYSANWYNLLCLAVPEPLGTLQLRNSPFLDALGSAARIPYFGSPYVSALTFALAGIGVVGKGGWKRWLVLAVCLAAVVLSLGDNLPFMYWLVAHVPGASLLRFPNKLLIFSILCLAPLAARGLDLYICDRAPLMVHAIVWAIVGVLCSILYVSRAALLPLSGNGAALAQVLIALRAIFQVGLVLVSLAIMYGLGKVGRRRLAAVVVSLMVLGLLCLNGFANCRIGAPGDFFQKPSYVLRQLRYDPAKEPDRITNIALSRFFLPDQVDTADRLVSTINNFQYNRQVLRHFTNIDFQTRSALGFEGAMVGEYDFYLLNAYFTSSQCNMLRDQPSDDLTLYRWLQTTSTRYIVAQAHRLNDSGMLEPIPQADPHFFKVVFASEPANIKIYELLQPLPRAYFAASWRAFPTNAAIISFMQNGRDTGFDPAQQTLIEMSGQAPRMVPLPMRAVVAKEPNPETLQIDVELAYPRLLVLQDQFYPGWSATIDGQAVQILRCNGFMRAVLVPQGKHQVIFEYRPDSLYLGLAAFLVGAVVCMFLWWRRKDTWR